MNGLRRAWIALGAERSGGADIALTSIANVVIAAFGVITGVAAARMLGPNARGELAAIQITPSFIGSLAMMGIPEALLYFVARTPGQAGRYLGTAVVSALVTSIPFFVIGYLMMPLLVHAEGDKIITDARYYLLIAAIWATVGMICHPLRSLGDFSTWNLLRILVPLVAVCVLMIAFIVNKRTPQFVAFGNLTAYASLIVPFWWIVHKRVHGPYAPEFTKIGPMLRYGFPCMLAGMPQMLNLRLDQILMSAVLPPRDLGLYVVAVAWSGAVSPILSSIGTTLLPSIASADSIHQAAARMSKGVRITVMIALLVCACIAAATPVAIPTLFGNDFRESTNAALILVPAAGLLGINFSLQEGIRGLGYPYLVLRAELLGLVVTALFLAVLLRPFGIVGAALASLAGYFSVTVTLLGSGKSLTGIPVRSLIVPRPSELKQGIVHIAAVARGNAT